MTRSLLHSLAIVITASTLVAASFGQKDPFDKKRGDSGSTRSSNSGQDRNSRPAPTKGRDSGSTRQSKGDNPVFGRSSGSRDTQSSKNDSRRGDSQVFGRSSGNRDSQSSQNDTRRGDSPVFGRSSGNRESQNSQNDTRRGDSPVFGRSNGASQRGNSSIGSGRSDNRSDESVFGKRGGAGVGVREDQGGRNSALHDRANRIDIAHIQRPPVTVGTSLSSRISRSERITTVNTLLYRDGYRTGFHHYDPYWTPNYFGFHFYVNDPWAVDVCYSSPFYYYTWVPAYIDRRHVVVISYRSSFYDDRPYHWHHIDSYDRSYSDLDYAVDDLVTTFQDDNKRALSRLVPDGGRVHIMNDGQYAYSLPADDFRDMMRDAIGEDRTIRYTIESVRENGRQARVVARHEFRDSWGERTTVHHTLLLEREGGRYVIREFGSSNDRP